MQRLHAIIQGKIPLQIININELIAFAEHHPEPTSTEYQLLELAINLVLVGYLEKAQKHR